MGEIKAEFKIGEFDFLINSENSIVELDSNKIVDLTIKADESVFDTLCENEGFEFGYGLYPPEFYAREMDIDSRMDLYQWKKISNGNKNEKIKTTFNNV